MKLVRSFSLHYDINLTSTNYSLKNVLANVLVPSFVVRERSMRKYVIDLRTNNFQNTIQAGLMLCTVIYEENNENIIILPFSITNLWFVTRNWKCKESIFRMPRNLIHDKDRWHAVHYLLRLVFYHEETKLSVAPFHAVSLKERYIQSYSYTLIITSTLLSMISDTLQAKSEFEKVRCQLCMKRLSGEYQEVICEGNIACTTL